ncbi:DUF441 family protein, partial [Bacillus sp. WP8]|uniref:DUF441 family protein n=1 Tax=Bacillus sp. WP8 TaxID=756828 RepID=UPI0021B391E7
MPLIPKNNSLILPLSLLFPINLIPLHQKIFPLLQSKPINSPLTLITIPLLLPIPTPGIGFNHLRQPIKSSYASIPLPPRILLPLIPKNPILLLQNHPHITP